MTKSTVTWNELYGMFFIAGEAVPFSVEELFYLGVKNSDMGMASYDLEHGQIFIWQWEEIMRRGILRNHVVGFLGAHGTNALSWRDKITSADWAVCASLCEKQLAQFAEFAAEVNFGRYGSPPGDEMRRISDIGFGYSNAPRNNAWEYASKKITMATVEPTTVPPQTWLRREIELWASLLSSVDNLRKGRR